MVTLTCPVCGSSVKVPAATPHIELSCSKCHSPFHLDRTRRPVVGSPPDVERDVAALKQKVHQELKKFPARKIAIGVATFVLVLLALSFLLRSAETLKPAAERAARAFANDDVGALKSMAASGTDEDLGRWYEVTHPNLLLQRQRWHGKPEVIEVGVASENKDQGTGSTVFSVHPATGNARDVSLANPDQTTEGAPGSFDSQMEWTLGRGGHWQIDGRATYEKVRPSSPSPSPSPLPATTSATK